MKIETLLSILTDELGAESSADGLEVPADRKVTILVRFGDDTLRVPKVASVRVTDDFVNLVGEAEQFFVDPHAEYAIKSENSAKRSEARPGFH